MNHNQDITGPNTITAGDYTQIVAPIYTSSADTSIETDLATGVVVWRLLGAKGIVLISKSSPDEGITVNVPQSGYIVVEILEEDTSGLTSGDYYHICEFTVDGVKLGLFDGIASIDNRAGMTPTPVLPVPYEDYCVVKYSDWPAVGTTITNEGTAGATYNGTATHNLYYTEPSGATAFRFDGITGTDYITIPSGAVIDDIPRLTMEMILYYRTGHTGNYPVMLVKESYEGGWAFGIEDEWPADTHTDAMTLYAGVDGGTWEQWLSPVSSTPPGAYYYLQLTLDRSDGTSLPTLTLNNVQVAFPNLNPSSTWTSYDSDATNPVYLFNTPSDVEGGNASFGADLLLFRLHDAILTSEQRTQNYNADKWRMGL